MSDKSKHFACAAHGRVVHRVESVPVPSSTATSALHHNWREYLTYRCIRRSPLPNIDLQGFVCSVKHSRVWRREHKVVCADCSVTTTVDIGILASFRIVTKCFMYLTNYYYYLPFWIVYLMNHVMSWWQARRKKITGTSWPLTERRNSTQRPSTKSVDAIRSELEFKSGFKGMYNVG